MWGWVGGVGETGKVFDEESRARRDNYHAKCTVSKNKPFGLLSFIHGNDT